MDRNIISRRFGITLLLSPSIYLYGTDKTPQIFISSVCQYSYEYFLDKGYTLIETAPFTWKCQGIKNPKTIRLTLSNYWTDAGWICRSC